MKKSYVFSAITILIILIAIFTNPNPERHKEAVKNKVNSYIQQSMKESMNGTENNTAQAGKALGMMLAGAFIDKIIDNLVSTDNYVLFSTTKITWDGKTEIIGIGAFGNVYLTRKIDEAIDEGLLKNN